MKPFDIRKNEGVKFIVIPAIETLGLVYHGFSTRVGGVSTGRYKSMNLSLNAGEDKDLVEINRCMYVKSLDAGNPEIYTVRQMHGTRVIRIENSNHPAEEYRQAQADAIVTDHPGVAIGVLTADCVPILVLDPVKKAIAAVHAGREGTVLHIVTHVVRRMEEEFGSLPGDLQAAVGPCIETSCYEVGEEVVQEAVQQNPNAREAVAREGRSYFMDLRKLNHLELLENGVREDRIHHVPLCTACHHRTFYSHRKSRGKETGRMMALMMLRG
jgi:YfiH family protein